MNEIIILSLVVWGYALYVQSSMRRLKGIVEKYKQKQRINLKEEKKKALEENYTKFWEENKFKLGIKIFLSFAYATFVICYPILDIEIVWLRNIWLLILIVVLAIMLILIIVFVILCFSIRKMAKLENIIKRNNHIFVIIFQPALIILLFVSVICISDAFFNLDLIILLIIKYGLIFVNITAIQDIENVFEDSVEKICMKIESRYSH